MSSLPRPDPGFRQLACIPGAALLCPVCTVCAVQTGGTQSGGAQRAARGAWLPVVGHARCTSSTKRDDATNAIDATTQTHRHCTPGCRLRHRLHCAVPQPGRLDQFTGSRTASVAVPVLPLAGIPLARPLHSSCALEKLE